jgi:hypothetical protein
LHPSSLPPPQVDIVLPDSYPFGEFLFVSFRKTPALHSTSPPLPSFRQILPKSSFSRSCGTRMCRASQVPSAWTSFVMRGVQRSPSRQRSCPCKRCCVHQNRMTLKMHKWLASTSRTKRLGRRQPSTGHLCTPCHALLGRRRRSSCSKLWRWDSQRRKLLMRLLQQVGMLIGPLQPC